MRHFGSLGLERGYISGFARSRMESLLISTGVVALAEIGDKTQLLAFILAARFKKPLPIIAGILVATLFNHGLAGALGAWITSVVSPEVMRWVLGLSFIGMATCVSSSSILSGIMVQAAMPMNDKPSTQRIASGLTTEVIQAPSAPASP